MYTVLVTSPEEELLPSNKLLLHEVNLSRDIMSNRSVPAALMESEVHHRKKGSRDSEMKPNTSQPRRTELMMSRIDALLFVIQKSKKKVVKGREPYQNWLEISK